MNTEQDSLVIFERAAMMLAEADTVQKCKAGKDLCATAERYAKAQRLSAESIQHARSYALEFERKLGEMLKEKPNPSREHGGGGYKKIGGEPGPLPNETPTLEALGVTKDESKIAQAVADLPEETFQAVKAGTISKKAAIRQSKTPSTNGEKSDKAPKEHYRQPEIAVLHDTGLSNAKIAAQLGLGKRIVDDVVEHEKIKRSAQAQITPEMLSKTAQQKLDMAIEQHCRRLSAQYEIDVRAEVTRRLAETIGPRLRKEQDMAKREMNRRKGIMKKATYTKIRACLHPDWVTDPSQKRRYEEAFDLFKSIEKLLLDEKDSPTDYVDIPTSTAEWEEHRRQGDAQEKARRAARKSGKGSIEPSK